VTPTKRVSVWSGPRNVSTALMYAFRQRSDTTVVDEPLYGHYLKVTDAPHPDKDEVLAAMETDGERVVRNVLLGHYGTKVVMFKNMAHHLVGLKRDFLGELSSVLLIRDPAEMLPSLAEQLPVPTLRDTGLQEQGEILEAVLASGQTPPVIDAKRLLQNPEAALRELCRRLGLEFDPAMLSWPQGPKPEDGVWAKRWYAGVHASSAFAPYRPKTGPFPERLRPLLEVCAPLYDKLEAYAL
jgi:hypothetical protein